MLNYRLIIPLMGVKMISNHQQRVAEGIKVCSRFEQIVDDNSALSYLLQFIGVESAMALDHVPFLLIDITEQDDVTGSEITETINNWVSCLLHTLWFEGDYAVFNYRCYGQNKNDPKQCFLNTKMQMNSDSNGLYTAVDLSFDKLTELFNGVTGKEMFFTTNEESTFEERRSGGNKEIVLSSFNLKPYHEFTRLQRAMNFIIAARQISLLPHKISMYVCAIECLFSSDGGEITHKVSERAALFLGGDNATKSAAFKKVKAAYKLRSRYLHGDIIDKKYNIDSLRDLSSSTDSLLRDIMNKATIEQEVFLKSKDAFDAYFDSLIFG